MPIVQVDPTFQTYYEEDDYTDPWTEPEVVVLIHGSACTSSAWFGWVPHLSRKFRVLRPDLRGFGRSSIPEHPREYDWSLSAYVQDILNLLDALNLKAVHVVGAKLGGSIGIKFAADHPERTLTLTVASSPARSQGQGGFDLDNLLSIMEQRRAKGLHIGSDEGMFRSRFGSGCSSEMLAWWKEYDTQSNQDVRMGIAKMVRGLNLVPLLPRIHAPTLLLTTEGSRLQSLESMQEYQQLIPNAELQVLPGDGYFVAVIDPDECARRTMEFLRRKGPVKEQSEAVRHRNP